MRDFVSDGSLSLRNKQLRAVAIQRVHGVREADRTWAELTMSYDKHRQAFEAKRDSTWLRTYAGVPEITEYAAALQAFEWHAAQMPNARDGLSQMRYLQSAAYDAVERNVQEAGNPKRLHWRTGTPEVRWHHAAQ